MQYVHTPSGIRSQALSTVPGIARTMRKLRGPAFEVNEEGVCGAVEASLSKDPMQRSTKRDAATHEAGEAAQSELWRRLHGEELVAEGVPRAGPPRVRIPASEWNDLDRFDFDGWSHDSIGSHREKTERYRGARVRQAEVVELWPEPLPKSTRLPPTLRPVGGGYMPLYLRGAMDRDERGHG